MPTHSDWMKYQLSGALKTLMAEKPLPKITIRELTEVCCVNRQTFYYHFQDIYDLLKWTFEQEIVSLIKKQAAACCWQDAVLLLLHYIEENKKICLCALHSLGHTVLRKFFYEDSVSLVNGFLSDTYKHAGLDPELTDFLTKYYTVSLGAMLESWLLGEFSQTPEQFVQNLEFVMTRRYDGQSPASK